MITLTRDCTALLIPSAAPFTIPAGTQVQITQQLGGTYTIEVNGQLARIEGKDRDALGLEPDLEATSFSMEDDKHKVITGPADIEQIWQQLRTCYDPEIPVNIVDLGLIYECKLENDTEVKITMTLTAPGCGMGPVLAQDIEIKVLMLDNVTKVDIEMVFDPPWHQGLMSDAAKLELGLL